MLRLAVEQEVTRADRAERKGDQSRNRAAGRDRQLKDAPPEKVRRLSSGEQNPCRGWKAPPMKRMVTWSFPAFDTGGEKVWLRATKNRHVSVTRITHQAAMRLGLPQSVPEVYQVQLRRGSGRPEHMLWAEGVETLECVRLSTERENSVGRDHRLEGLGAGEAIPVQRVDNPRKSACGSGRTCLQMAPEGEPQSPTRPR